MDLNYFQITFLAFIQGLTEYLPISSSAHILLPKELFGWPDQGLVFDVAVHVGSLIAVVTYFRRDIRQLIVAWFASLAGRSSTEARLAWYLVLATIPAGVMGLLLNDMVEAYSRSMLVIGTTSIVFGILLYFADRYAPAQRPLESLTLRGALIIGLAQVMALIPGTSRSGVTMTAGLFCGLDRRAAAKFSFLLAIPIIMASGLFKGLEMLEGGSSTEWGMLLYAIVVSAVVSFACIHLFLRLIERIGFMPFIIYRVALGILLYVLYFSGALA